MPAAHDTHIETSYSTALVSTASVITYFIGIPGVMDTHTVWATILESVVTILYTPSSPIDPIEPASISSSSNRPPVTLTTVPPLQPHSPSSILTSPSSSATDSSATRDDPTPHLVDPAQASLSTAEIVGVCIGGLASLISLILLVWFLRIRRREKRMRMLGPPPYSHESRLEPRLA